MILKNFTFKPSLIFRLSLLSILITAITISMFGLRNANTSKSNASASPTQIKTAALIDKIREYKEMSAGPRKNNLISEIISLATQRKFLIKKELNNNPDILIENQLSNEDKLDLPKQVDSLIEKESTIIGKYEIIHVDYFDSKKSEYLFTVKTPRGKYNLHFTKAIPESITGSVVQVKGLTLDSEMVLDSQSGGFNTLTPQEAQVDGNQKTAVVLINFGTNPVESLTKEEIKNKFFDASDSVTVFYKENSFDQTRFFGDILGWFTLDNFDGTNCGTNYNIWSDIADKRAGAAGADMASYKHKVYVFSGEKDCTRDGYDWAGMGTIGGNPSRAWISDESWWGAYAHETGHNLGTNHANLLKCDNLSIDEYDKCENAEYGDMYDVMGGGNFYHFNAPHKVGVGWIGPLHIKTVTSTGAYTILPLEFKTTTNGYQVLKIYKANTNDYYYISYRTQFGFDNRLPNNIVSGASIHIWSGSNFSKTKLINTHPETPFAVNSALTTGESFYDPSNRLKITQLSQTSEAITIQVSFGIGAPSPTTTPRPSITPTPKIEVGMKAPQNGQKVSGSINLIVDGSPKEKINKVCFYLDKPSATQYFACVYTNKFQIGNEYKYTWDTKSVANGAHQIFARATLLVSPSFMNTQTINFTVDNSIAPSPGQPSPTRANQQQPTITPPSNPSPTPTGGPRLNFKINNYSNFTNIVKVTIQAKPINSTTFINISQTITDKDGFGSVSLNGLTIGNEYYFYIKGDRHLRKKYLTTLMIPSSGNITTSSVYFGELVAGDTDNNNIINPTDRTNLTQYYLKTSPPAPETLDLNQDHIINYIDSQVINDNMGRVGAD